ncbi:MAG TPA: hypothetical protein VGF77_12445 [Allosphingosinicella sp.]|jgi:hypothetical protein
MAEFKVNVPVVLTDPTVTVDFDAADPLPLGKRTIRLVVVDDQGNMSEPAFLSVLIVDVDKPTAVLETVDAGGSPIPATIPFGQPFRLSGQGSKDVPPGKVAEYRFTLLGGP